MQLDDFHRQKNHHIRTREHYRAVLRRYGDQPLSADGIAVYRDSRSRAGVAPATIRGEVTKLVTLARWAGVPAVVALPPKIQRAPMAWSARELRSLFNEARGTNRTVYGVAGSVYYPALLGLAYDTGERIGAMLALEWSDVDLRSRTVRYRAETRKGRAADMVGSLSRDTARRIARLKELGHSRPFLLGSPSTLWGAYGKLLRDAGLPSDRRSKFHRLRRTHATWLHARGGDATASLGHASDATTRAHYIDVRQLRRPRLPNPLGWLGWLW
jgi:integrase